MSGAISEEKSYFEQSSSREVTIAYVVLERESAEFPIYWLCFDESEIDRAILLECLDYVLIDPVYQTGFVIDKGALESLAKQWLESGYRYLAEKQFLPAVTDNLAHTVEEALRLAIAVKSPSRALSLKVASGRGFLFNSAEWQKSGYDCKPGNKTSSENSDSDILKSAAYSLYHPLVEVLKVHALDEIVEGLDSVRLGFPRVASFPGAPPKSISLELSDNDLEALSRQRLLALSLDEMKAIARFYAGAEVKEARRQVGLSDSPTDVELEVLAQTWSEHCKHKIFNADIRYRGIQERSAAREPHAAASSSALDTDRSSIEESRISSLYKTFIKGATRKLSHKRPDLLSVFEDNSGVVAWTEDWAICFKVETHNSPSALEPYGGALTGILGVNRDILGTGLGARPIFNTDVFCFAHPDRPQAERPKLLPPAAIPPGVRKGVEDGGNKSGIPTVNGSIFFDDSYRAKPLVFCGTGGILPVTIDGKPAYGKYTKAGDRIMMVGGRVGRDGIHGATFSSESMSDSSPVSAVQIGDPFTQKRVMDFVIEARDRGLITGITDNGAGGLSSSVGEMAGITGGATMELDCVPLKYPGLEDWQIVVSESQERMTISTDNPSALIELGVEYGVEVTDIGFFDNSGYFKITRDGRAVCYLPLSFLHDGLPALELEAEWLGLPIENILGEKSFPGIEAALLELLAHPNVCSREEVIRQYDHEVQGASVIKPLMGPHQEAPCDAAVLQPLLARNEGLVVSNGLAPSWSQLDPYLMALLSVDEAVRNAICVGAAPETLALLDNFCWPDPVASKSNSDGARKLGQLVRACQGLHDACLAFGAPLISGKDSMKNDFDDGVVRLSILPTLLISAIAKIDDASLAVSMDFKGVGDRIYLASAGQRSYLGSLASRLWSDGLDDLHGQGLPRFDSSGAPQLYRTINEAMKRQLIESCHDLSEGGLAVALSECCLGGDLGAKIEIEAAVLENRKLTEFLFAEGPSSLLLTVAEPNIASWSSLIEEHPELSIIEIGFVEQSSRLEIVSTSGEKAVSIELQSLRTAWKAELPF